MKQYVLKAVGTRDILNLTKDKLYTSLKGKEEGIFENSPYVTIIDDYNKRFSCHFNRFEIIEEFEDENIRT